jgi:penicillin amidase
MAATDAKILAVPAPRRGVRRRIGLILRVLLGLLLVFIVAVGAFAAYLVLHPLPLTNGTASLPGLSAAATVVRDKSGMPHLTAATLPDLLRAQGYVMAQDRLWQMDFYRRVAAGRLSEVLGDTTVDTDRYLRTIGLHRAAEKEWASQPAEIKTLLQAYADGVSAFIAAHGDSLPLEFTILGYKPEPWSPVDSIAFSKVMALDLGENMDIEIAMADLQAKLGPEKAAALLPAYPDGTATIVGRSALPGNPAGRAAPLPGSGVFGFSGGDELIGSNNWVIDGTRSADGQPLLANDPHLSVQNPSIWYAMHLQTADGSFNVEGVTLPGAPGIVVGHNAHITWGVTNLGPDTQDFFVEKLDESGHPGQYAYQDQWLPLEVVTETIHVKGAADIVLPVRSTAHGPLMNPVVEDLKAPTALQWTALMPGELLKSVLDLDRATNWQQFHAALSNWDVPAQNFVYADSEGNIGYQATGLWPIRKGGNGLVPVEGWTGANDWTGYVPYEQMPSVLNPPEHFLVTANNRVVAPDYPHLINAYWFPWFRAERITQLIQSKPKLSMDDFKAMQYDTISPVAVKLGPALAALSARLGSPTPGDQPLAAAIGLFQGWNGDIRADSAAAALYEPTVRYIISDTFGDELGDPLTAEYRGSLGGAAVTLIYQMVDDPTNAWWDDTTTPAKETRDDILLKSVRSALGEVQGRLGRDMSKWTWGALHTVTFNHTLGAVSPLDRIFNFGPYPMPGDSYTVAAAGYNEEYAQRSHSSMRMITSPGDWTRTQLIFSPGESGQPGSAHWGDLVQDYLQGRYRPLLWSADQIKQNADGTLTLQP